jgi:hypothetical protein
LDHQLLSLHKTKYCLLCSIPHFHCLCFIVYEAHI